MTIGLIYPPQLRTSLDDNIPCDPAEINTYQSSNIFTANFFDSISSNPIRKSSQPPSKRHRRNVSFHNQVIVIEVERVPRREAKGVWWTFGEMDQFRSEAAKCKERRKISTKRSARTNSHIRTILGQQTASQELDGIQTDPKMLSTIACESSKKARESAHRIARKLEQEIEQEVYVHERSKPLLSAKIPVAMDIDHRRRIPDFHWGAVVDAFTDTVTCGISSNVRH